jgi:hypothetical protein
VETRAYRPARHIFVAFRAWQKTCSDFAVGEARFMGISERHSSMTAIDPFRPCENHHTPALASVVR